MPAQRFIVAVTLLLAVATAAATEEAPIDETYGDFVLSRDIAYAGVSERQRLDILRPSDVRPARPVIVLIHSGGWYTGDKGGPNTLAMMRSFAEAGYVAVSVGYRLSDEAKFPAAVEDCKQAVRWLRGNADRYGVDPRRIAAMGASAGGHLAALLALTTPEDGLEGNDPLPEESSAVQAAVVVAAPVDLRMPLSLEMADEDDPLVVRFLGGPLAENQDAARRASPVSYARNDAPPILIVHGTADKRVHVTQAEAMIHALEKARAPYEAILVEGGRHGMGIAREPETFDKVLAFLARHLNSDELLSAPKGSAAELHSNAASLEWWRNAKLGLFVHWGPSSLTGEEIRWARGGARPGMPVFFPVTMIRVHARLVFLALLTGNV
jgi:acetyl esterase/lipase